MRRLDPTQATLSSFWRSQHRTDRSVWTQWCRRLISQNLLLLTLLLWCNGLVKAFIWSQWAREGKLSVFSQHICRLTGIFSFVSVIPTLLMANSVAKKLCSAPILNIVKTSSWCRSVCLTCFWRQRERNIQPTEVFGHDSAAWVGPNCFTNDSYDLMGWWEWWILTDELGMVSSDCFRCQPDNWQNVLYTYVCRSNTISSQQWCEVTLFCVHYEYQS